jgi:hypothetical protein
MGSATRTSTRGQADRELAAVEVRLDLPIQSK